MIIEIIIEGLLTNINRKDDCDKARRHIGKGCAMVVENGDVWILNQSDSSIFVQVMKRILEIWRILMSCLEPNMQLLSQSSPCYSCKNSKRLFYKNFWQWKVWRSPFLSNEKWIRRCIQRRMVYAIDKSLMIGEFQSGFLYIFQTRTTLLWYRT